MVEICQRNKSNHFTFGLSAAFLRINNLVVCIRMGISRLNLLNFTIACAPSFVFQAASEAVYGCRSYESHYGDNDKVNLFKS